jgi:hypothetical protein
MATAKTGRRIHTTGPRAKATPPDTLTEAQVAELQPLVARAAIACARCGEACEKFAAFVKAGKSNARRLYTLDDVAEAAREEAMAAGKALADALARLGRVAK